MVLYKIEEFKRGKQQVEQAEVVDMQNNAHKNDKPEEKKHEKKNDRKKEIGNSILIGAASALIASLITLAITTVFGDAKDIYESSIRQEERLTAMAEAMSDLSESVDKKIERLDERIDEIALQNSSVFKYNLIKAAQDTLTIEQKEHNLCFLAEPSWTEEEYIVVDDVTGEHFTAKELYGETVLLPYVQGDQEIIFMGQFNKNMHWDGKCTINVYRNEQLELITDATYDDGVLKEYQQVLPDTNLAGVKVWLVSDRICEGEYNTGDTWSFFRENEYKKTFSLDNVDESDVLSARSFMRNLDTGLEGFYHGNTCEGLYNDDTGEAYMVKYTRDGYVRLVYRGCVVDGQFNDKSGKAWSIAKEEDTDYMYFKGNFIDGKTDYTSKYEFKNPISVDEIQKIVACYFFDCKLQWDDYMKKKVKKHL